MKPISEINKLIQTVSTSSEYLEPAVYDEICSFIQKSQTLSGAFTDRGGQPDMYYSLFGFLISKAFGLNTELNRLKKFISKKNKPDKQNLIDLAVWIILRYSFKPGLIFKLQYSVIIAFLLFKKRKHEGQVYHIFLSLLILNHFWGFPKWVKLQINKISSSIIPDENPPTSFLAAMMVIRSKAGLGVNDLSNKLLTNAHPDGGFMSFSDCDTADMLSTAVAAYSLLQSHTNVRSIVPGGLDFITANFQDGAFLSGDGDQTKDIEYTFYGLLALNSYSLMLVQPNINNKPENAR